jgi:hypothetical protein
MRSRALPIQARFGIIHLVAIVTVLLSGCKQLPNEMNDYLTAAQEVRWFQGAADENTP